MPLLETLMLEVGASIGKALLKKWTGGNDLMGDVTGNVVDTLKGQADARLAQRRAKRQFEMIGEHVGRDLLPIFEGEGAGLDEGARTAVALEVGETLNRITSEMVVKRDLEPTAIARQLLQERSAQDCGFSEGEGMLYERTVKESCMYIVEIAKDLPQFTERTYAEILSREGQLLGIADKILAEVARMRAEQDPTLKGSQFELEYLRTVRLKLDRLELFGSGMSMANRRYSLSLAYITLSVERRVMRELMPFERGRKILRSPIDLAESGDEEEKVEEIVRQTEAVDEALKDAQSVLIFGEAGSGKTTLLQWIAVQAATHTLPVSLQAWNTAVPFYIRLRQHVAEASWPMPEAFVKAVAPEIAGEMPYEGWAHQYLRNGRAIVLVDGIDEVPEGRRESVYEWIEGLMEQFPKAHFVVTSRPYAVAEGKLRRKELVNATLLPMKIEDIELFVEQWHTAIRENMQDAEERMSLPEAAEHLKEEIGKTNALRMLAKNPLLCAMLCALNWAHHQQLPSNRIELYEECCKLLIERRDSQRKISLEQYPAAELSYEQKVFLLEDLAYWYVRSNQTEALVDEVDRRFTRKLQQLGSNTQHISGTDVRQLFVERSGIIRTPMIDAVDFAHRTFQEYLTAKAIVYEEESRALVQQAHEDQWREIVPMVASMLTKKAREEFVQRLMKQGERRKNRQYRLRMFTLAALSAQAGQEEVNAETKAQLQACLKSLVPLQNMEDVELLRQVGELAVPCFEARIQYSTQVAVACVNALTNVGSETAYEVLETYRNDYTSDVINAMIMGLESASNRQSYATRFLEQIEEVRANDDKLFRYLKYIPHLTSLSLDDLPAHPNFSLLSQLPHLTSLTFWNLPALSNLSFLSQFPHLSSLLLFDASVLSDLSALLQLPNLAFLTLWDLPALPDLSFLAQLPNLSSLDLRDLPALSDLSFLAQLPNLSSLNLYNLPALSDLSPLKYLKNLKKLTLRGNEHVWDFSVLEQLEKLERVELRDFSYEPVLPENVRKILVIEDRR